MSSTSSWAAAWRRSTATTTARPDLYFAGGDRAGRAVPQRQPVGGALRVRADAPTRSTDLTRRHRRLPARRGRRPPHRPRRPAGRRERAPSRPGRLSLRARQRGAGLRRRRCVDRGIQRHLGGDASLPTLAIGNYLVLDDGRPTASYDCDDNELRPARCDRRRLRGAGGALAGLVLAVGAVQRLGPIRPPRPARLE